MKQKFDVEVTLSDLHTTTTYTEIEADNKAEAALKGERLAIRLNPTHIIGKVNATLSSKRIDAERRMAAMAAFGGYETYSKKDGDA